MSPDKPDIYEKSTSLNVKQCFWKTLSRTDVFVRCQKIFQDKYQEVAKQQKQGVLQKQKAIKLFPTEDAETTEKKLYYKGKSEKGSLYSPLVRFLQVNGKKP